MVRQEEKGFSFLFPPLRSRRICTFHFIIILSRSLSLSRVSFFFSVFFFLFLPSPNEKKSCVYNNNLQPSIYLFAVLSSFVHADRLTVCHSSTSLIRLPRGLITLPMG